MTSFVLGVKGTTSEIMGYPVTTKRDFDMEPHDIMESVTLLEAFNFKIAFPRLSLGPCVTRHKGLVGSSDIDYFVLFQIAMMWWSMLTTVL